MGLLSLFAPFGFQTPLGPDEQAEAELAVDPEQEVPWWAHLPQCGQTPLQELI